MPGKFTYYWHNLYCRLEFVGKAARDNNKCFGCSRNIIVNLCHSGGRYPVYTAYIGSGSGL